MALLERQRRLLDFTLSSLLRRKGKNGALVAVYALTIFLLASVLFFGESLRREASIILADAPSLVVQRMMAGRHELIPDSYADQVRSIRGVRSVKPRLWGYYYDPLSGANYTIVTSEERKDGTIAIGSGVASTRKLAVDDVLPLRASKGDTMLFTVAEVLSEESALASADLMIVTPADFREFFAMPAGFATDLIVDSGNPRECSTIAEKIAIRLPDTRPIVREEILRTYDAIFGLRSGMVLAVLACAVIAFLIFAWDKATGLSAEERAEIGILKAVGWDTSDVLLMKFWEGTVISVTAFLAGTALAYAHVFLAGASLFEPALKGWSVIYPAFRPTPVFDPAQIVTIFFLTVVPYIAVTVVPVWRAATIDPDAVMRT